MYNVSLWNPTHVPTHAHTCTPVIVTKELNRCRVNIKSHVNSRYLDFQVDSRLNEAYIWVEYLATTLKSFIVKNFVIFFGL